MPSRKSGVAQGGGPVPCQANVFGELVNRLRKARAWSRRTLAEMIGKTQNYVYRIERQDRDYFIPPVPMTRTLATVLAPGPTDVPGMTYQLLLRRAFMLAPPEIQERLVDAPPITAGAVPAESMPAAFLRRVRGDVKGVSLANRRKIGKALGLTGGSDEPHTDPFAALFHGTLYLPRSRVIQLAQLLKQPVGHYLVAAELLPEELTQMVQGNPDNNVLLVLQRLDPESCQTVLQMLEIQAKGLLTERKTLRASASP